MLFQMSKWLGCVANKHLGNNDMHKHTQWRVIVFLIHNFGGQYLLVNNAFKQNIFPDDMKRAKVTPIFKKKDDLIKNNYRPVSILSVISNVFETIVAEQLRAYFENIFNNLLCAYRKSMDANMSL